MEAEENRTYLKLRGQTKLEHREVRKRQACGRSTVHKGLHQEGEQPYGAGYEFYHQKFNDKLVNAFFRQPRVMLGLSFKGMPVAAVCPVSWLTGSLRIS